MDLDFDRTLVIQCVECANTYTLEDAEAINEATSSAKCPYCSRWNYVDCISLTEMYIDEMEENDLGGQLYDFRTGKLEDEFPTSYKGLSKAEKKKREKERRKMIENLKDDFKKTLGLK